MASPDDPEIPAPSEAESPPPAEEGDAPENVADPIPELESSAETAPEADDAPEPEPARPSFFDRFAEPPEEQRIVTASELRRQTRRDFLLFGTGTVAAAAAFWWLLPDNTQSNILSDERREWLDSLAARLGATAPRKENFLNRALTFDDDVAEALYSRNRRVRSYKKSDLTALRNNYDGQTPDPAYIGGWTLALEGLASGKAEELTAAELAAKFRPAEQITRICCVEGWSAIAWWGGIPFSDFLRAYPPEPDARWASLASAVNLDSDGDPDPYYVSIDLATAEHPQTLLAMQLNGRPLTVEHGAPMRLVAPMKLGLKNIKAITKISYSRLEPPDYWNERGYSKYDGL